MQKAKRTVIWLCVFTLLFSAFTCFAAEVDPAPEVTAKNVLMVNLNTGAVIYKKSSADKIYPASTTKVMTLLVALDHITDMEEEITISQDDAYEDLVIGSSNIALKDGEEIRVEDLLYAVSISSANEAANALAIHVAGDRESFVTMMNEKAKSLGLKNTHFVNTHGLHDENHYTTAEDLAVILQAALQNETLVKLLSATSHTIGITNKTLEKRRLNTTNKLLVASSGIYYKYCEGGKTGSTTAAGYNLVSWADKDDMQFLLICMQAPRAGKGNTVFNDSRELYRWAYDNHSYQKLVDSASSVAEVKVELSAKTDHVVVRPSDAIRAVVPNDFDPKKLEYDIDVPESVLAPVQEGDKIGTLRLHIGEVEYGTVTLIANDDVERSTVLYYLYAIRKFFSNIWVQIICIILLVLLVLYIFLMIRANHRRKRSAFYRRRRRRRF